MLCYWDVECGAKLAEDCHVEPCTLPPTSAAEMYTIIYIYIYLKVSI